MPIPSPKNAPLVLEKNKAVKNKTDNPARNHFL